MKCVFTLRHNSFTYLCRILGGIGMLHYLKMSALQYQHEAGVWNCIFMNLLCIPIPKDIKCSKNKQHFQHFYRWQQNSKEQKSTYSGNAFAWGWQCGNYWVAIHLKNNTSSSTTKLKVGIVSVLIAQLQVRPVGDNYVRKREGNVIRFSIWHCSQKLARLS